MLSKYTISMVVLSVFFLNACSSPQYKIVYEYSKLSDKEGLSCLNSCYVDEKNCKSQCEQHYQQCATNARDDAEESYLDKQKAYEVDLREYDYELEHFYSIQYRYRDRKENLDKRLKIYSKICNNSKDKDAHELACSEVRQINRKLDHLKKPVKPRKPNAPVLKNEISQFQSLCSKSCDCESSYRNCYTSCGGTVTTRRVCVNNCD